MADPYVYSKFALKAIITTKSGDVTFDDVVSIGSTFKLNDIPTAELEVAVGYEARSNRTKKATIHDAKNKLRPRDKVVVTLTITPAAGDKEKTESGEFVIFEGFLTGIGYNRAINGASYHLHVVHWLDDLNNSSAINGNWFPNAPHDLAYNAACYATKRSDGNASVFDEPADQEGQSVPIFDSDGSTISKTNAEKDLWGDVIKPVLTEIAKYTVPPEKRENTAAIEAFKRIPGRGQRFNTPLALDLSGLSESNIQDSLRRALTNDALASFGYTSFWGKIEGEYASQFFFAVSPGVEHALMIPFFGGLRWEAGKGKEITADEYISANFNANMKQLLEAIVVHWPIHSGPNHESGGEGDTVDEFAEPLGAYPPVTPGIDRPGLKLFKEPPGWISNNSSWTGGTGASTGIKGSTPGDCMAPGTGDPNPPKDWLTAAKAARKMRSSNVCQRFAHHWYKTELLGARFGSLSGKLRFDIAPGSIVRIEMPIKEIGSDGYMVAAVTSVSYIIDAERMQAGTSFALGYIRTIEEDADEKISTTFAPLYKAGTAWHGGPLKTPSE
jgi:hypothetical protein